LTNIVETRPEHEEEPEGRPGRRGLAGALLGATAAIALLPEKAVADLSFGDVQGAVRSALRAVVRPLLQAIQQVLGDIFDFLREIFALIGISLPTVIWQIVNDILDLLDQGGDDTYVRSDRIGGALERSYPLEAITTPNHQWDMALRQEERTRVRVQQAMLINARIAESNGEIATAEEEIHAAALASGSVAAHIEAILAMLQSTNIRLGHLSSQMAAQSQLVSDLVMQTASAKQQSALAALEYLNEEGREIADPVDRPAR
jgi:hypothetical protein